MAASRIFSSKTMPNDCPRPDRKEFQTRIVELKNENGDLRWAVHVAAKEDCKRLNPH
jgi:hypothetical protein